ncbi:hypothetical protein BO94DRAFT_566501 [Aspergillus sclerotioniger CBS 115572]|uniref:SNF2 family helicase n=1 Tax=Aspergillus sclerotioniger CBS 115572 TaxID=1450535 RepID=A0A317WHC5_9EURO|nr:hypothetical protein BO94DRAFT_566501 [Aspergillus sclerotioniger CBS 115572]PWY85763.1 hypothetical protein BO94DRAFT_566501 [Aspergillus sclerotioniger CBS 115572]
MGRTPAKRRIEQVDLTGDDDERSPRNLPSKSPRTGNGERLGQDTTFMPLNQSSQVYGGEDEDDAQAADLIQGSQVVDDSSIGTYIHYGDMPTKIVGHVRIQRDIGNAYDSNAIRVSNVMGAQIGHIPRTMAAKLAKYMDDRSLMVEGVLTGVIGAYDCPISLKLFGTGHPEARQVLKSRMEADKLPLGAFKQNERNEKKLQKEREKAQKDAAKLARSLAKGKGQQWQAQNVFGYSNLFTGEGLAEGEDLEELIGQSSTFNPRDIGQVAEDFRMKESDLENMPMAETPVALATQLLPYQRQENPSLPGDGGDVVQLWKKNGNKYTNIATNYSMSQAPPLASGGILADDMGLGKTIQIISLILANSQPKSPESSSTTLIVSPVGVMSNWRNQARDHIHSDKAPKVLIYHGQGKKEASNLDYYGALAMEYSPNAKDLYSQVRFLRLSGGLEDLAVFNSVLIRPLVSGDPDSRLLLQALMTTICLRRRKDMNFVNLRLPPLTSRILRVKFHPHEQEKYDMFQAEAKGMLLNFKSKDKTNATYSHLLEVILRLRQVCNHWALCKNRLDKLADLLENNKIVPLTPENIKALQDLLQIRIESQDTCPICLDNLEQPVITACAHAFDCGCIEQVIERQHKCPMCRAEIQDTSTLVSPTVEMGESIDTVVADPDNPSSKIEALIKILTAQGQAPGTKTVVFSQWTSFLNLIEPHLQRHGIGFARIDGKMTSINRDNSTLRFSTDPTCTVLLASLSVCSVGLNLVAANQAVLADSWWAPAIEDQAVDRVYRLGQKRETTDRVLAVQENKRKLMLEAFRETATKKKVDDRATRVADLEKLLN